MSVELFRISFFGVNFNRTPTFTSLFIGDYRAIPPRLLLEIHIPLKNQWRKKQVLNQEPHLKWGGIVCIDWFGTQKEFEEETRQLKEKEKKEKQKRTFKFLIFDLYHSWYKYTFQGHIIRITLSRKPDWGHVRFCIPHILGEWLGKRTGQKEE